MALGFTALALQPDAKASPEAEQVLKLAHLLEEFCRLNDAAASSESTEMRTLMDEAQAALKLCLETGSLTWDAELEADAVCRKIASWTSKAA
jgi:hypothetical protein